MKNLRLLDAIIKTTLLFIIFLTLLLTFSPSATAYEEGLEIDWLANSVVYAERFPVVIHNYMEVDVELTVSCTSYSGSHLIAKGTVGYIIWIDTPVSLTTDPTEPVEEEVNLLYQGNNETYTYRWAKRAPVTSIERIEYAYHWFSYWTGSSNYSLEMNKNGSFAMSYDISYESGVAEVEPFAEDFNFSGINETTWNEFLNLIDLDQLHTYQTWSYYPGVGMCDGGGYQKSIALLTNAGQIFLTEIIDNDSCSGTRSAHANINSSLLLQAIHDEALDFAKYTLEYGPGTTSSPAGDDLLFFIVSSPLAVIVLLKRRKSY